MKEILFYTTILDFRITFQDAAIVMPVFINKTKLVISKSSLVRTVVPKTDTDSFSRQFIQD